MRHATRLKIVHKRSSDAAYCRWSIGGPGGREGCGVGCANAEIKGRDKGGEGGTGGRGRGMGC